MKLRKQSHCVYQCEYHLVLATKYRRKVFNGGIFGYMLERLKGVKEHYPEIEILEIEHDKDHVHMLNIRGQIPLTDNDGAILSINQFDEGINVRRSK